MQRVNDITGNVYTRLVVIRRAGKTNSGNIIWECRCVCGNLTKSTTQRLSIGDVKSCGCLKKDKEFLEACNWLNLRPLWAEENQSRRKELIWHGIQVS
jgi:hypothetical protein